MRVFKVLAIFCMALLLHSCGESVQYVTVETDLGNMKFKLYNSTPQHRDNFIKLAKEGFYDDLLFHRVINGFMAQGGDPNSKNAGPNVRLGGGGPGYKIPAEIGAPHFKGTLAAARDNNPEKSSSGSQFYIVQGRPVSDLQIQSTEKKWGITYNEAQKEKYKTLGGTIGLDMDYTVFGEIVEGMEVIDKLCAVPTNGMSIDRPLTDVKMKVKVSQK